MAEADAEATLPPRPRSFPHLEPGRVDVWRLLALIFVIMAAIMQIVLIYVKHVAHNDYGTVNTIDPLGFAFWTVGGLLDLFMVGMAFYVRHRQSRGNLHFRGYIPHPGFLLFIDLCVMGGSLGWGGLSVFFAVAGEDGVWAVYSFAIVGVGLSHLKLTVDDCGYIHYKRKEKRLKDDEMMMDNIGR